MDFQRKTPFSFINGIWLDTPCLYSVQHVFLNVKLVRNALTAPWMAVAFASLLLVRYIFTFIDVLFSLC